jgi:hypothetical protein
MSAQTSIEWTDSPRKRLGPYKIPARDGDKQQAVHSVNLEVRSGRRPHPNFIPCVACGHVWTKGEMEHEYHHHRGYGADHHLDVISLCNSCHSKANRFRTHCPHGHEYTKENTGEWPSGGKYCRECQRIRKRKVRTAEWWRNWRAKRRERAN